MATPFDPSNPFNIRGVNISPALPGGTTVKNNVYYYLIFIDIVKNQVAEGGVNQTLFAPANYQETGSILTYNYPGVLQTPVDPSQDPSQIIQTLALPLYTNQKIDKPDPITGNNLTVAITYADGNGNNLTVTGNPNSRKPPVFQVLNGQNMIQGVQVTSLTDNSTYMAFMANTGSTGAINCANVFSNINDSKPEQVFELYFEFQLPHMAQYPWQNLLPGQGHSVAAIGYCPGGVITYPNIVILQPNSPSPNPDQPPGIQGLSFPLPLPDMQYIPL